MPAQDKQDLRGFPCPALTDFWINRCYGRKSRLVCDGSARMAIHFAGNHIGLADAQVVEIKIAPFFRTQHVAAIDNGRVAQCPSVIRSFSQLLHCQQLRKIWARLRPARLLSIS